ncbi:MAG: DNA starvation/stationary phase protection protein [Bacteroidetes bacterium]|nr:DNA starvation/stationary phase protection protein [Bacteroidota bacterium]
MSNTINELNKLLADYQIYYQNLRGFHWNIKGQQFFELHVKFEELYNDAAMKIDEIAERILTLEATPLHSFSDYLAHANLSPVSNISKGEECVSHIVENLTYLVTNEKQVKKLAEESDDSATADQMAAYIEEQEKTLWMYKSWLG